MDNQIRKAREAAGLRQIDLAKLLDVTQATLSNWERGEYEPDNSSLRALSKHLGVTVDYLLGNRPAPYTNEYGVEVIPADPAKVAENEAERARMRDENREKMRQTLDAITQQKSPQLEAEGELADYLEELRTRPEMKMFFSVTKDATKEQVERSVKIIEAFLAGEKD